MLVGDDPDLPYRSLADMIEQLDVHPPHDSFGADIDCAQARMYCGDRSAEDNLAVFLQWAARWQPCLFGRLGAKGLKGVGMDVCWLTPQEIRAGDEAVRAKIQRARRAWKERAAAGLSHGFLIMYSHPRLARARPGPDLVAVCRRAADLYLIEHAPVECDVIYTEAIPLRSDCGVSLYKGGINLFYPSAHRTLNHDRRVPGGLLISVNSPGHYANSLVARGLCDSLDSAVSRVSMLAINSIGNGGLGDDRAHSCSWRNALAAGSATDGEAYSRSRYSAFYHTDVLVPARVTADGRLDPDAATSEHWPHLVLDYISARPVPPDHVNYALFRGMPVPDEARYHNPWPPRRAVNSALADV